jgi:formylglycine-generating enzyme required for sulfatase activity
MLREYAWYTKTTNNERTWPVGQLKPNDWGLFDMQGNVLQWCQDPARVYHRAGFWLPSEDREEAVLKVLDQPDRVLRGGAFLNQASLVRSAFRDRDRPTSRIYVVGLRVARTYD